jgi:hypothetical protein
MAEIHVKDGETKEEVARRLLDQAAHPDHVVWQPRSGVAEGGIFYVPDDEVDDLIARVEAKRDADRRLTEQRIKAADERDAKVADTGLTPEQLGFPANATGDPGSFPVEDVEDDDDELELDEDGEPVNEPGQAPPAAEEEPKLTRAEQRRRDRKRAADEAKAAEQAKADTTTANPAEKTDKE